MVRLDTGPGPREIFVRYAGCDHHGVDDGTTVRQLTPEIAASVFDRTMLPDGVERRDGRHLHAALGGPGR